MIDVQVSNNKLFFRAIGIVALFSNSSEGDARVALLRSVHGIDALTDEVPPPFKLSYW
jgi:hypothetical protein